MNHTYGIQLSFIRQMQSFLMRKSTDELVLWDGRQLWCLYIFERFGRIGETKDEHPDTLFGVNSVADAKWFILCCVKFGLNYHPDVPFGDYKWAHDADVPKEYAGKPCFTVTEVRHLDHINGCVRNILGNRIYGEALGVLNSYLLACLNKSKPVLQAWSDCHYAECACGSFNLTDSTNCLTCGKQLKERGSKGLSDELKSLSEALNIKTQELVQKFSLQAEQLTEVQLASAIRQAIACGDFIKCVVTGQELGKEQSAVVYLPYHEAHAKARKVDELMGLLQDAYNALNYFAAYAPGVNSIKMDDLMPKLRTELRIYSCDKCEVQPALEPPHDPGDVCMKCGAKMEGNEVSMACDECRSVDSGT